MPPASAFKPAAKSEPPRRRPTHAPAWEQLAGDLGIAPRGRLHRLRRNLLRRRHPTPPSREPGSGLSIAARRHSQASCREQPRRIRPPAAEPECVADLDSAVPEWDDLEPSATEPRSFEPQEALDIMDETADEFGEDSAEETSASSESARGDSAGGEAPTEEQRSRRRRRRRGRGRGREGAWRGRRVEHLPHRAMNWLVMRLAPRDRSPWLMKRRPNTATKPSLRASRLSGAGVAAAVVAAADGSEFATNSRSRKQECPRRGRNRFRSGRRTTP